MKSAAGPEEVSSEALQLQPDQAQTPPALWRGVLRYCRSLAGSLPAVHPGGSHHPGVTLSLYIFSPLLTLENAAGLGIALGPAAGGDTREQT